MAKKEIDKSENIILGSGDLYLVEYTDTIPDDETIEDDDNRAGNIKSGATLEYSSESTTVEDDKGRVKKTTITKEAVRFKSGMLTWSKNYIEALVQTARVDETSKPGHRIIKLGGLANASKKRWLFRFVHTRDDGRKLRVTVTGKNTGTLSLAFQNDNPTTCDAEITAETLDESGTLVILDDQLTVGEETAPAAAS